MPRSARSAEGRCTEERSVPVRCRRYVHRLLTGVLALGLVPAVMACGSSEAGNASQMGNALNDPNAAASSSGTIRVSDIEVPGPASNLADPETGTPNVVGAAAVPVRVYEPAAAKKEPWATLVWAHGGSFMRGTLDWPEADWVSRRFAEAGLRVLSVDYTLASDAAHAPAPVNDVAAVLRRVLDRVSGPVFVGGASAGGQLAVASTLQSSSWATGNRVAGLALVYPTLHRVQRPAPEISQLTASLPEERRFRPERIAEMYRVHLGDGTTPVVGELASEQLAALPPTVTVAADADDLRASAEQFTEQLHDAGVDAAFRVQPGTVHGYLNRPEESVRARQDAQHTIDIIVDHLRGLMNAQ